MYTNCLYNTKFTNKYEVSKKSFFGCTAYLLIRLYGIYMKEMTTILNDQNSLKNIAQPFFGDWNQSENISEIKLPLNS